MIKKLTLVLLGIYCLMYGNGVFVGADGVYRLHAGLVEIPGKQLKIPVEIADNRDERARGLMFRAELPPDRGLLLVFRNQQKRHIWMKNMQFPLDVLFLAADGKIVSMLKNLPPCHDEECEIFSSTVPAQSILEVNAGFIDSKRLKVNEVLLLRE